MSLEFESRETQSPGDGLLPQWLLLTAFVPISIGGPDMIWKCRLLANPEPTTAQHEHIGDMVILNQCLLHHNHDVQSYNTKLGRQARQLDLKGKFTLRLQLLLNP